MSEPTLPQKPLNLQQSEPSEAMGGASPAVTEPKYSFRFDRKRDTWVCSVHGDVDDVGWVNCYAGCDEGYFDAYEDDPINCDPGEAEICSECNGEGGWMVCGQCNAKNPDVEW